MILTDPDRRFGGIQAAVVIGYLTCRAPERTYPKTAFLDRLSKNAVIYIPLFPGEIHKMMDCPECGHRMPIHIGNNGEDGEDMHRCGMCHDEYPESEWQA